MSALTKINEPPTGHHRFPAKTLNDLEWQRLLEHLADNAAGELSARRCLHLPFLEPAAAQQNLALVGEFIDSIVRGDPPPSLPAEPVDEALVRVRGGSAISGEVLLSLARNMKLYVALARYLDNRRDVCPGNAELVLPDSRAKLPLELARLAAEIESSFEPDGSIADSASPELARLRRAAISHRENLLSHINKIAEKEADLLQDRTITLRNNRFVIPVRADAHRRFPGIVHGTSSSGATIFVEPESAVALGNELMLIREAIAREEARVLSELSDAVLDQIADVNYALDTVVTADVRIASARLGDKLGAAQPVEAPTGYMELIKARHPLLQLDGVEVVPSSIKIWPGHIIVVSGPNAGGKTVVLKTIGLIGLMLSAGQPVPVAPESRIGLPSNILTDIGDEQSLTKNLSTFSAHMTNIASIIEEAGDGTVVLLDELAAGTDPTEGSAIAIGILEHLGRQGATTLCTSHFDALKNKAQTDDTFSNAAVGFDFKLMRPTFALTEGVPGSSSALSVAGRYGIPPHVVERAQQLLPEGMRELAVAVQALEEERLRLEQERTALTEEGKAAETVRQKYKTELDKLRNRQNRFVDREVEELWSAIRGARAKVAEAEKSFRRKSASAEQISKARRELNEVAEATEHGGALSRQDQSDLPGKPATADSLSPGTPVYVVTLKAQGIVESPPKGGKVFVRVGIIRSQVAVDHLRIVPGRPTHNSVRPQRKRATPTASATDSTAEGPLRTSDNSVDLRGMTVDEAVDATDAFLDQGLSRGLDAVFIIHGHGTGALRDSVRSYLKGSRYVSEMRPGEPAEGGDGITVAWLR